MRGKRFLGADHDPQFMIAEGVGIHLAGSALVTAVGVR